MVHEVLPYLVSFSATRWGVHIMETFSQNGFIIQLREVEGQSPGRQTEPQGSPVRIGFNKPLLLKSVAVPELSRKGKNPGGSPERAMYSRGNYGQLGTIDRLLIGSGPETRLPNM